METYYFQIKKNDFDRWDDNPPMTAKFKTREDAVSAAYLLSLASMKEVRFTDNEYWTRNSGSYILHRDVQAHYDDLYNKRKAYASKHISTT